MSLSYGLSSPPQCFPLDVWIMSCWELGKICLGTAAPSLPLPQKIRELSCKYQTNVLQSVSIWWMATRGLWCYSQWGRWCLILNVQIRLTVGGIWVCPLCLLWRSETCLAHAKHVISCPLRVPTTLALLPHLNNSHAKLKNQLWFCLWGDLN